jgi:hypothetical protein
MTAIDREKILSLGVTRYRKEADKRDRQLAKDRDAYRRLRMEGLQPPRLDGAHRLEAEAVTSLEVQTGVVSANLSKKERQKMAGMISEIQNRPA